MKQQLFEKQYTKHWQDFADILQQLESNQRILSGKRFIEFSKLYRQICHLQSIALSRNYSRTLVDELDDLVIRGYRQLYRRRSRFLYTITNFFFQEFPQLIRQEAKTVWLATAIFYLPAIAIFIAIVLKQELVYSVFEPAMVSQFETMYAPENHKLGEAREAETDLLMFGFYIKNNIGVAFRTFALGIVIGLGSIFFLAYNGLILGAISAHLLKAGITHTFFSFVIGHGSFELTAITLAGAAGLKLGYSLIAPGEYTRMEALRRASLVAIKIMYGVIAMLLVAAFVEAFWSANGALAYSVKYTVGAAFWVLVIAYLTVFGRQHATR